MLRALRLRGRDRLSHRLRLPGRDIVGRLRQLGPITYLLTQGVLLFWWVAFYPGLASYDSVMYVWQVSTGNWTTQHSTVYNGLLWLSLRATGGYAPLTLAQTVALAAGLAYAVTG